MRLPDRTVLGRGGVLAKVVEMQGWLTLFKRASSFSVGENTVFQSVHKHRRWSIQPLRASHDSLNVQFGITQVGIPAAGGVLFHHQIRIRAQLRPRRL